MKSIQQTLKVSFIICLALVQVAYAQSRKISLNTGWEFHEFKGAKPEMAEWRSATVPGAVHTDLLEHKLIPDPFYRDNETKVQWVSNTDWEYRKTITADKTLLSHKNIELVFEGLNTLADVYIDGKWILKADNMFREWRVNIKPFLKAGNNVVSIVFHQIKPEIARLEKAHPEEETGLDTSNAMVKGFAETLKQGSYVRKAAYEKGWDWGPSMVTCGIWRPVYIQTWDNAKISDFGIVQTDISAQVAHIEAKVQVYAMAKSPAILKIEYGFGSQKTELSYPVTLHEGKNELSYPVNIVAPQLWYPHGYGAQNLYHFKATLVNNGNVADQVSTRTGLRSVQLNRERDSAGRKFEFVVNGIPVFAKGANIIPFDHFPTRVTKEKYRHFLEAAVNANMNMMRLWGGGYYETQEFYDTCDELGIMIWHDFMFANATPPDFLRENIEKEIDYQVRRLRNHPCIAVWSGNNEITITMETGMGAIPDAFKALFDLLKPKGPGAYINYLRYFEGTIPNIVKGLSPEMPYTNSSPTANFEQQTPTFNSGDRHNYDVWWNNKDIEVQSGYHVRFMSETGIQAFPDMQTVNAFTLPEDRDVKSHVMMAHQKNYLVNGNTVIAKIAKTEYREATNFNSFVYLSQLVQAESLKIFAESMRRQRPFSMGLLYWQLNDSWPVISWATMDWYGRPKAALYYAKQFFSPVLVSPFEENDKINFYVVSDLVKNTPAVLSIKLMDFNGKTLFEKKDNVTVKGLSSSIAESISKDELKKLGYDPDKNFIVADLSDASGSLLSSNNFYFKRPKDLKFPAAEIQSSITSAGDHYVLTLSSAVLAPKASISFGDADATLSNNFFDLLPGKPVSIVVKSKSSLEQLKKALKIVSLNNY
jgi:beta-mannosidase